MSLCFTSINTKILSTALTIFAMFLAINCSINQAVNDIMNNPPCDKPSEYRYDAAGRFDVCKCD